MPVSLKGPSPAVLTAGILLLSRARTFGQRLDVEIIGDPEDITPVLGPAIVHSPVMASCGVGRDLGAGALVIVPGPPAEPLAASLSEDGTGEWFLVDRAGGGAHPATRAFVRLCRDSRPEARRLSKQLRRALVGVGLSPEPALLDFLFGAPAPPLFRAALALRAARAMTGERGAPITRIMAGGGDALPDPLQSPCTWDVVLGAVAEGRMQALLDRLGLGVRDEVEEWLAGMVDLVQRDRGRDADLVCGLAEVAGDVLALPASSMLPLLSPAMDAVAVGLGRALGAAAGTHDANLCLAETFRFLGGRFADHAPYAVELEGEEPGEDRLERWRWMCSATRRAVDAADALWRRVTDPDQ